MQDTVRKKYDKLLAVLSGYGSAAVAFSGGVDSTLLLRAAKEVLGEKTAALTARATVFPEREFREAEVFCRQIGVRQLVLDMDELAIPGFRENPKDRCYICKRALFSELLALTRREGLAVLAEGSNMDDCGDYRPGLRAVAELGAASPLREAGLYKSEIREILKDMGLPVWEKPSFACLASRFVYGETITEEKLRMVDEAETYLHSLGFAQVRVRIHGYLARIEALPEDFPALLEHHGQIAARLKGLGFSYVTMDLQGYRTGSMNETLKK